MTFADAIKSKTGKTLEELSNMTLREMQTVIEKRIGRSVVIETHFPIIGRGNVMRDRLVSHKAVEKSLEESLR
ncbi:MAG: hypothetical protein KAH38_01735 [Candidatus Hydrogenedentes bacterium]|nr:hypothetical protein [Candidatus Hydrogenedentota bacterium]